MGCARSFFQLVAVIGATMLAMGVMQVLLGFIGYSFEGLDLLGDPNRVGLIMAGIGLIVAVFGRIVGWVLDKIYDKQMADSLRRNNP